MRRSRRQLRRILSRHQESKRDALHGDVGGGRIRASSQRDVAYIFGPPKRRRLSAPRPYLSFSQLLARCKASSQRQTPSFGLTAI